MKMSVSEFAKLTGVSVRTLHHYDSIGLLCPDFVDEQNGYRFYGDAAFEKMQQILFYRELDFSLKAIKQIISSENYNKQKALREQRKLLVLKRQRLDRIIDLLCHAEKGEKIMDFNAFDQKEIDSYKKEVESRWGKTEVYLEHSKKTANYTADDWNFAAVTLNQILADFAALKSNRESPNGQNALNQVKRLQDFITNTQYSCTVKILNSLGEMYVADKRFKNNIDKNGVGTAEFISKAIKAYCKNYI